MLEFVTRYQRFLMGRAMKMEEIWDGLKLEEKSIYKKDFSQLFTLVYKSAEISS